MAVGTVTDFTHDFSYPAQTTNLHITVKNNWTYTSTYYLYVYLPSSASSTLYTFSLGVGKSRTITHSKSAIVYGSAKCSLYNNSSNGWCPNQTGSPYYWSHTIPAPIWRLTTTWKYSSTNPIDQTFKLFSGFGDLDAHNNFIFQNQASTNITGTRDVQYQTILDVLHNAPASNMRKWKTASIITDSVDTSKIYDIMVLNENGSIMSLGKGLLDLSYEIV